MGLSWELGRWPIGPPPVAVHHPDWRHQANPAALLPSALRARALAPLCPTHRALRSKGRIGSQSSAPRGFASRLSCGTLLPYPQLSSKAVSRLFFSGLISFHIKAKPSPGCEYNAPRASRGEERGAETSRGQQRGMAGGGGWWDVTRLQQVSAMGCSTVTSRAYFCALCSRPKPRLPGGRGGVGSLGVERGTHRPLRSKVHPPELRGSPTP